MAATIWLQIIRLCRVTRKHKPFGASILINQSFLYLVSNSKPAIQWVAGLLVLINQTGENEMNAFAYAHIAEFYLQQCNTAKDLSHARHFENLCWFYTIASTK